jgi:poly-beta-1,6-N-acetyl-D-glucosamine synthase
LNNFVEHLISIPTEPINIVLLGLYLLVFLIQLFFYLFFYRKILSLPVNQKDKSKQQPVSIVICAKNEAINLRKFLPSILNQKYPDYTVIVVNDCSSDDSDTVLSEFKEKYSNLYVTTLKEDSYYKHGKKLALTVGIKAVKTEWLLLTDADCCPESENWIAEMQANFTDNNDIVLGYGGYYEDNTFLNKVIRFETMFIAIQYMTFAIKGVPYMGIGRNLAYRKSIYEKNKGFSTHYALASGDDDLFINKVATSTNVKVVCTSDSFTRSIPKNTFDDLVRQKKRHFSTYSHYKKSSKLLLGTELGSRIFFYFLLILLLVKNIFLSGLLLLFFIRFFIQFFIFKKAAKKFNEPKIQFFATFFDFIVPIINFNILLSHIIGRKNTKWR